MFIESQQFSTPKKHPFVLTIYRNDIPDSIIDSLLRDPIKEGTYSSESNHPQIELTRHDVLSSFLLQLVQTHVNNEEREGTIFKNDVLYLFLPIFSYPLTVS